MNIAIGSDHAAILMKLAVADYLSQHNIVYKDFGAFKKEDDIDYPDFGRDVSKAVASGEYEYGILMCGTGIGMSIVANKVKGIRAAHCTDIFSAKASREHNDANILTIGERITSIGDALKIVETFINTAFVGGRHSRRIAKITALEDEYFK